MKPLIAPVLVLTILCVQSLAQTLDSSGVLSSLGIVARPRQNANCICTPFHQCFDDQVDLASADNLQSLQRFQPVITVRQENEPSQCTDILDICCRNLVKPLSQAQPPFPPPITSQVPSTSAVTNMPSPLVVTSPPSSVTNMPSPLVVTGQPSPGGCGIRNSNGVGFTIAGFRDGQAQYGEFPWTVALLKINSGFGADMGARNLFVGGGSLIAPNVVLTAAHKAFDNNIDNSLMARIGEWNFRDTDEPTPHQDIPIREVIYHPRFSRKNLHYNFALLVLERSAQLGKTVGTICLPSNSGQRYIGQQCLLSGWGQNVYGELGRYQRIMKIVNANMVEQSQCQSVLQTEGPKYGLGSNFVLDESFVCAGDQGQDACTGDGGSPLVCQDPTSPGKYVQVGISSWGLGCGQQGIPGVYADVAKATPWIQENLDKMASEQFNVRDG